MTIVVYKKLFIIVLLSCALATPASALAKLSSVDWVQYKQAFLHQDGRIVDKKNAGISHSEGQGYGLLLSFYAQDKDSFDRIWKWTKQNLRRQDGLFAWKWQPETSDPVPDWNNATDGDLLIAWALVLAAERWDNPEYSQAAIEIAIKIRTTLVRDSAFGPIIMPAQSGFDKENYMLINPSYWVFPAFSAIARQDNNPVWQKLIDSGMRLLSLSRFGSDAVPPDWVRLYNDGRIGLASEPEHRRFGYEALRVPLYVALDGRGYTTLSNAFLRAWFSPDAPDWVDLVNQDRSTGGLSLAHLAVRNMLLNCPVKKSKVGGLKIDAEDYYGSTVLLLTRVLNYNCKQ